MEKSNYPITKNTNLKESQNKTQPKELLSIYKTKNHSHTKRSTQMTSNDTEMSSSIMYQSKNQINIQKVYLKHFNSLQTENQKKNNLNIINDLLQNYATPQTISTAEAFKYSQKIQNIKSIFSLNSTDNYKNLSNNLSSAIKNKKQSEIPHVIPHFHSHFHNIFLQNLNKHQNHITKSKDKKINEQRENQKMFDVKKSSHQIIDKNYPNILVNSKLQKFTMVDLSISQNNQTKNFINLLNQLQKIFTLKNNQNKKRKLKTDKTVKKIKSNKVNTKQEHTNIEFISKSSRNSSLKKIKQKSQQKKTCFLTQALSPIKYSHKNTKQNSQRHFLQKDFTEISQILMSQNTKINQFSNQKIILTQKQSKTPQIKNKVKGNISRNGAQKINENLYFLSDFKLKISKTSTVTPKVFSRYPSEINIQQKPISALKSLQRCQTASKCLSKVQSPMSSHLSTPKTKIYEIEEFSNKKNFKVKMQQKDPLENKISQKKSLQNKKSLSKSSKIKQLQSSSKKLSNCNKFTLKNQQKIIKKDLFDSDKQNVNFNFDQYGMNLKQNKKSCIIKSLNYQSTQINKNNVQNINKMVQRKVNKSSKGSKMMKKSLEKDILVSKRKEDVKIECENMSKKMKVKGLFSDAQRRRNVFDQYLCE